MKTNIFGRDEKGNGAPAAAPGKASNSLRKAFGVFRKRKLLFAALFLLVCIGMNVLFYARSLRTADTVVSLDYEEASQGLTPSRTRFNIFEIQSADVLERLIDYAGLRGEITADELSECIRVRATHDRNVSGSVNYISTSYIIEFTNDGVIPNRTAEAMLSLLCKSYREFFVEHYGINHSILSFDVDDLRFGDEYLQTADLLELKCDQLAQYVRLRRREDRNFRDPDTGMTFAALQERADNFRTYDLARLRSYIIENGIANDKTGLNAMLEYKIRMDLLVYDRFMAAYEEDNRGIEMYDAAMSAIVMIPTEDEAMKYYMSKTKTGMDNMALHADAQLAGAAERTEDIEYNRYLIEKLQENTPEEPQRRKADGMIRQMDSSLEQLADDIRKVDDSFTSYKARNYLSFQSGGASFSERIRPLDSILTAALVLCAVFAVVFIRDLLGREKRGV